VGKTFIVDYGSGNITSVVNAVRAVGGDPLVSADPRQISDAANIILPGVGAFGEGMSALARLGFCEEIIAATKHDGKPLLGICLGMQLLAERSTEHGDFNGFALIPGKVTRIQVTENHLRIPHIGWNEVFFQRRHPLVDGIPNGANFYFVHSYAFHPREQSANLGTCTYGDDFTAVVVKDNIMGTQFHPEKSQKVGLLLLKNFLALRS
jgi:imidazole glycerol-phosphate synthase subunit HisH